MARDVPAEQARVRHQGGQRCVHARCARVCAAVHLQRLAGFTRLSERQRWDERALFSRYHILPVQEEEDTRPVLEASPYYLSGMPDSFEDLTRFTRYIPGVKMIALVRNPVDRAFSEYIMFSEPPFKQNASGCGRGPLRARFETLAVEELAVASPALNEDGTLAHRCLTDSTKWQQVPRAAGRSGMRMLAPCCMVCADPRVPRFSRAAAPVGRVPALHFALDARPWA